MQISVCQLVNGFKPFHESNRSSAGILNILVLSDTGAFEKQIVCKPLLLARQVLDDIKSGSGKRSERLVAIVVHIDLLGNSAEAKMVGNHKGIHPVVLWQVRIGFLKLPNLLGIQNMDFSLKATKAAILSECVNKAVSVDGGSFQTNHYIAELHRAKRRHDSF